jgi:hypothetical protein
MKSTFEPRQYLFVIALMIQFVILILTVTYIEEAPKPRTMTLTDSGCSKPTTIEIVEPKQRSMWPNYSE